MDRTVGIVSRNLVTLSNFVKFQDGWDFTLFEVSVSSAKWHDQMAATWPVVRATHDKRRCGMARAPKSKCASDTWQDLNTRLLSLRQVKLVRGTRGKWGNKTSSS